MEQKLLIYNTLTRTKERFTPLHAPNVGMYEPFFYIIYIFLQS